MGRPAKLADTSFLPGTTSGELKEMYNAGKDGRDKQKMLVAYHFKSGMSIRGRQGHLHGSRDRAALDSRHVEEGRGGNPASQGAGPR